MFWKRLCELCNKNNTNPSKVATDLGLSNATASKWKKGSIPNGITLDEIATYFNVTTDYLLCRTDTTAITQNETNIKFALFDTSEGITDEMLKEVKQYAEMVRVREENKRRHNIEQSKNDDNKYTRFVAARSKDGQSPMRTEKASKEAHEELINVPETDMDF